MKSLALSIRIGWRMLFHPIQTVDELDGSSDAFKRALTFILFADGLWMLLTLGVNVFFHSTSRGREHYLGLYLGPDIFVSLLTIPIAAAVIALAARLSSWIAKLLGGIGDWKAAFIVLAFSLNAGSIFFDYPNEVGFALVFRGFERSDLVPDFFWWALFVMVMPILWSFIATVAALSRRFGLGLGKTLAAFLGGVLPMFALLLFFVA